MVLMETVAKRRTYLLDDVSIAESHERSTFAAVVSTDAILSLGKIDKSITLIAIHAVALLNYHPGHSQRTVV